jgi:hypothetical protein
MIAAKTDVGFYGNDTDLVFVTRSGRVWLVERPDEGSNILRELKELPKGVESYKGVFPAGFEEEHLARIQAAGGATWIDWPPQI